MKKNVLWVLAVCAMVSAVAGPVTPQRAQRVARTVLQAPESALQEVGRAVGFQHLYCYNRTDNGQQGFVVVSSDDATMPIIAFSDEGTLDADQLNPTARWWLSQYDRALGKTDKGTEVDDEIAREWKDLENGVWAQNSKRERINSLLDGINWGQNAPYNMFCPGGSVTGCVATALGQIMRYWSYPEHGWGYHSYTGAGKPVHYPSWTYDTLSADFEHTYYDWEHMPKRAYINSSDTEKTAVATLLYHLGVALDMNYSPSGSGCWSLYEYSIADGAGELDPQIGAEYRIPKHFGYRYDFAGMRDSIGDDDRWCEMLYQSLAAGKPIYYAGWAVDSTSPTGYSTTSGHGFVIDGYRDGGSNGYFHLNWGWDGSLDGWFSINSLKPHFNSGGQTYTYDFTQWHGAIIGLEPDTSYHGGTPFGIETAPIAQGKAYGIQGQIVVKEAGNMPIAIYDMMGRKVAWRASSAESEWTCRIARGIYVVKIGNSRGVKVVSY